MKILIRPFSIIILTLTLTTSCSVHSQSNEPELIGNCEGCEGVLEFKGALTSEIILPAFFEEGLEIKISGTVYKSDGKTPAPDVVFYLYQTNQQGRYTPSNNPVGFESRHGRIRGWLKTDENGRYAFRTLKPAPYPSRNDPAHIHLTVLEPSGKYYWLDSYVFKGDPLLETQAGERNPRGGQSNIVELSACGQSMCGIRDIILGKNVPGY